MTNRTRRIAGLILVASLGLTAAACGDDDDGDADADAPPATAAPAEGSDDTEAPDGAQDTTADGATTTEPSEPAPSGEVVEFTFAQGSPGLMKAFMEQALDNVEATTGHRGEFVELADSDLVVQGAAEGQFDMGSSTTSAVMNVIQSGANLVFVAEASRNQWTLISKADITSCADIDGKRLGLHSPGGVSTALYRAWYQRNCDGAQPTELYIEGSPNRLQALLEDQVDVSMVELEDTLALPEGEFNMLANFTEELSDIKTNLIYANRDFAEEHPDVVQAFVTELTKLQQQAMEDPAFFAELVTKWVPDTAADIDQVVAAYIEQGMLPTDGGMSQSDLESSIAFYTEAGVLEPGLTPDQVADRSFIEEATRQ